MNPDSFDQIVAKAFDGLSDEFKQKLDNVEVVVEDWPDPETLRLSGVRNRTQLLGFYHGIPQTKRTHTYGLVLPDKISIYRQPILMRCRTARQVRTTVEHVLRHEIAHHFGISDKRLQEIGAY